jgi:hypothetical protein
MSVTGRFWLSLALASIRVIRNSRPTMARSCPSMKVRGASSTDQAGDCPGEASRAASCLAVSRRTTSSTQAGSSCTISWP